MINRPPEDPPGTVRPDPPGVPGSARVPACARPGDIRPGKVSRRGRFPRRKSPPARPRPSPDPGPETPGGGGPDRADRTERPGQAGQGKHPGRDPEKKTRGTGTEQGRGMIRKDDAQTREARTRTQTERRETGHAVRKAPA